MYSVRLGPEAEAAFWRYLLDIDLAGAMSKLTGSSRRTDPR